MWSRNEDTSINKTANTISQYLLYIHMSVETVVKSLGITGLCCTFPTGCFGVLEWKVRVTSTPCSWMSLTSSCEVYIHVYINLYSSSNICIKCTFVCFTSFFCFVPHSVLVCVFHLMSRGSKLQPCLLCCVTVMTYDITSFPYCILLT